VDTPVKKRAELEKDVEVMKRPKKHKSQIVP